MKLNGHKMIALLGRPPARGDWILMLGIMGVIALSAWKGTVGKSNTTDELIHMLAGHAAWQLQDYRLHPENGTLSFRVAALPLQIIDGVPQLDTTGSNWAHSSQWQLGRQWLFQSGADHKRILQSSRLAMLIFNMSGLAIVFLASARLWGRGGGYLSLLLVGFSPNFIGHLPLATSDVAGTWTLFLSVLAFACLAEKLTPARMVLSGLAATLAVLTKHSGVMLLPIAVILLVWRALDKRALQIRLPRYSVSATTALDKLKWLLSGSFIAASICVTLIWLAFGFRYSAANPAHGPFVQLQIPWEDLNHTLVTPVIGFFRHWKLLPEALIYGFQFISAHDARGGFLNGAYSTEGFPLYHVWTFIYKTPLPSIILILLGMGCLIHLLRMERSLLNHATIRSALLILLVYGFMLAFSHLSIGYRHAFPFLFVLMILSGASLPWSIRYHAGLTAFIALLALSLPLLLWSHIDRTIAYMNFLGGGEKNGFHQLADSSLDWGQDLPAAVGAIEAYQSVNPGKPVYLSYFGSASPAAFGLENAEYLYSWGGWTRKRYLPELEPGLYVITASALVTTQQTWTIEHESGYRLLMRQAVPLYSRLAAEAAFDVDPAGKILSREEIKSLQDFEYLRAQRLKTYLQNRTPDEIIHGTVLLFDLDREEILPFKLEAIPDNL